MKALLKHLGALCMGSVPLGFSIASAATFNVTILDDEFSPKSLTIAPGDTVVWKNVGGSGHTVTADDSTFDSSTLAADQLFTWTFPIAGRNPYYCQLHGGTNGQGMAGVVRVVAAGSSNAPSTPTNSEPAANSANVTVSPTLTASAFVDPDSGDLHKSSQWILRKVTTGEIALDTGETESNKTSLHLADLDYSTAYVWKVRFRDDRDAWSDYSAETQFTTVAAPAGTGSGLRATYGAYAIKVGKFTPLAKQVDSEVNFNWNLGKPHPSTPANNFLVRWEGKVLPEFSERYRFHVRADGGVRLWINGNRIIDDWVVTPFVIYRNGVVPLEAGVPAEITLEYFDTTNKASVDLRWSSRSQPLGIIPQSRLFPLTP